MQSISFCNNGLKFLPEVEIYFTKEGNTYLFDKIVVPKELKKIIDKSENYSKEDKEKFVLQTPKNNSKDE